VDEKTKSKYRESKKSEKKEGIVSVSKTGLTTLVFIVVKAWCRTCCKLFYNLFHCRLLFCYNSQD